MLIPHPRPLVEGRFLARYDRFIARVKIGAREYDAHCVNPGRMEGLIRPGCRAWVSAAPENSKRKLRLTLELLEIDGVCIGVNTQIPNLLAETVIRAGLVPGARRYRRLEREVRYGKNSRIDLRLTGKRADHFIEVKNCHLVYPDGGAYFPDSVSTRATRHLDELCQCVEAGQRASVLFTVQRDDARFVAPSWLHDRAFAHAAGEARARGVRFLAAAFRPGADGFRFLGLRPVSMRRRALDPLRGYRLALDDFSGWIRRGARKSSP